VIVAIRCKKKKKKAYMLFFQCPDTVLKSKVFLSQLFQKYAGHIGLHKLISFLFEQPNKMITFLIQIYWQILQQLLYQTRQKKRDLKTSSFFLFNPILTIQTKPKFSLTRNIAFQRPTCNR
jgi:hypothetical protein